MNMVKADLKSLNSGIATDLARVFPVKLRMKDKKKFCLIVFLVLSLKSVYLFCVYPWRNYCGKSL